MYVDEIRAFCLGFKACTEDLPFGPDVLAFRVGAKIFALCDLNSGDLNLKAEPERAILLRERYPDLITGGYHMNKKHWNTLKTEALPRDLVKELIKQAYDLVWAGLPKAKRKALELET